jgi:hypothetical protein
VNKIINGGLKARWKRGSVSVQNEHLAPQQEWPKGSKLTISHNFPNEFYCHPMLVYLDGNPRAKVHLFVRIYCNIFRYTKILFPNIPKEWLTNLGVFKLAEHNEAKEEDKLKYNDQNFVWHNRSHSLQPFEAVWLL